MVQVSYVTRRVEAHTDRNLLHKIEKPNASIAMILRSAEPPYVILDLKYLRRLSITLSLPLLYKSWCRLMLGQRPRKHHRKVKDFETKEGRRASNEDKVTQVECSCISYLCNMSHVGDDTDYVSGGPKHLGPRCSHRAVNVCLNFVCASF